MLFVSAVRVPYSRYILAALYRPRLPLELVNHMARHPLIPPERPLHPGQAIFPPMDHCKILPMKTMMKMPFNSFSVML